MVDKCAECKTKRPSYNFPGQKELKYCQPCANKLYPNQMINVKHPKCVECQNKIPSYNFPGEKKAKYCKSCAERLYPSRMMDISHPMCTHCKVKRPHFNFTGEKQPKYCQECAELLYPTQMENITTPKCKECKKTQASFNFPGQTERKYCKPCADRLFAGEMVDVKHPKCLECQDKIPSYNFPGENQPKYCQPCAQRLYSGQMISINGKLCIQCKSTRPSFNFPNESQAKYCKSCSDALFPGQMKSVKKKCVECKELIPSFNFPGEKEAKYCSSCANQLYPEKMINLASRKCLECKTIEPCFNFPNEENPKYCRKCADHLFAGEMVDVRRRMCQTPNCGTGAGYGLPGVFASSCFKHKSEGMIPNPRKRCSEPSCKQPATHGITNPDTCETHSKTDYILLTERHCKQCQRLDVLNTQGVCVNFCSLDELDRKYKKHLKQKEDAIRKLFQKELKLDQTVIQTWEDSVVDSSCTRRRPDFVFHCGTHVVIVEVDEHQHKSYSNCGSTREEKIRGENRRMFEIFQSFQSLHTDSVIPVLFIRYNPDAYTIQGRKGKTSDKQRRETLVRWVQQSLGIDPLESVPDPLSVLYLYFDEPVGSAGVDGFVKVDDTFERLN